MERAKQVDVLVIDDLGDQELGGNPTTVDKRRLTRELVNYRHSRNMITIITTNLSRQQLFGQFSGPVAERIFELCLAMKVNGVNLREKTL